MKNFKMNKKLLTLLLGTGLTLTTTSCGNKTIINTTYNYYYAIDINDDNAIIYTIDEWKDTEYKDKIQVLTDIEKKEGFTGNNIRLYCYQDKETVNEIARSLVGENGNVTWFQDIEEKVKTK